MALSGVRCTVDSCHFWVPPNNCDAPKVEVDVNHAGFAGERGGAARGAGMEIGEMGVYRRGVVEPEGTGDPGAGRGTTFEAERKGGIETGRSQGEARKSEHTCCRTFRPRS